MGCEPSDLDEHGYCHHLVGFAVNGKEYEPILVDGPKVVVDGRQRRPVQAEDVRVNPQREQLVNQVRSVAHAWVSDRIYRKNAPRQREPLQKPAPAAKK